MKKFLVILTILLAFLVFMFFNIKNNISSEFKGVDISNVNGIEKVYADLRIDFDIINNSLFSFNLYSFKILIYDSSGRLLGENRINEVIRINKGVNNESVLIKNAQVFTSLENFVTGSRTLKIDIEFRVLGIKIKTTENVNF